MKGCWGCIGVVSSKSWKNASEEAFLFLVFFCFANMKNEEEEKEIFCGNGKSASGMPLKEGAKKSLENLPNWKTKVR